MPTRRQPISRGTATERRRSSSPAPILAAALAIAFCTAAMAWGSVVAGPIPYNGHSYYVLSAGSWYAAEDEAILLGGHLVTINDPAEQNFVFAFASSWSTGHWIGFAADEERVWSWISGAPITFVNWSPTEPNNYGGNEYCAVLEVDWSGEWNDLDCFTLHPAVVEAVACDPLPTLSVGSVQVDEGNLGTRALEFPVTLNVECGGAPVTLDFTTVDGTATAGDGDYLPVSGTLTFDQGEVARSVTVQVRGDTLFEPDETFSLVVTNLVNATPPGPLFGVGTIVNDDATAAVVSTEVSISARGGKPAVATDPVGRRVVAWEEPGADGSGLGVLAQLSDSAGVTIGSTFQVNVASAGDQGNPAVAFDPAGNFVIVWETLPHQGVFARRFDRQGAATTGDLALDGGTGGEPDVGLSASGEAVVVFERDSGGGVVARRVGGSGALLGSTIQIESQLHTGRSPRVVRHASGRFVAAWERAGEPANGSSSGGSAAASEGGRFSLGWFDDEGTPQSGDVTVDPGPNTEASAPDLGGDAEENVWVAWREEESLDTRVSARRFQPDASPDTPELTVADPPSESQVGDLSISTSPSGGFGVGWEESSASGDQIGAQLFDETGTPATEEVILPTGAGEEQSAPSVALDEAGRFHVGYQKQGSQQGVAMRQVRAESVGCVADDTTLCLNSGRFKVEAFWRDFDGNIGVGRTRTLTDDTGAFWFFNSANLEVVLKVLDAQWSGFWWIYFGALSDVEYTLIVTDTESEYSKTYFNPAGHLASRADTNAIPVGARRGEGKTSGFEELVGGQSAAWDELGWYVTPFVEREAERGTEGKATCSPTASRLCLQNGRFSLRVEWLDHQGHTGTGTQVVLTSDTGYFWFFNSANIELVVKVLEAEWSGYWWLFYGALSDVEYTLTVIDELTGHTRTYFNPRGNLASRSDTQAFPAD